MQGSKPIERTEDSRQWVITFNQAVAFKCSSESYYLALFALDRPEGSTRSFLIEPSQWIAEIEKDGVLDAVHPDCRHYVIFTDHLTIEVIAPDAPNISMR